MRASGAVILALLTAVGAGCGAPAAVESSWVQTRGGILPGSRERRAEVACAALVRGMNNPPRIHVLDSADIGAYSWPDGNIFVTRGLMDLLDDQQLVAAIAHEMGHLLADGHLHTVVSLRGCARTPDAEARADSAGVALLRSRAIPPEAMIGMLRKLRAAMPAAPVCQRALGDRIELIETQLHGSNTANGVARE